MKLTTDRASIESPGDTPDYRLWCQPMNVAFAADGPTPVPGLRLVVPTGSTVIRAAGIDDLGMSHSISISAPFVAIFPVEAQFATVADDDRTGWVIALKPGVLGQVSQVAFDALPKWAKFWDPFLSEAAETLANLHHADLIDAARAAAFADVVSVHIAVRYGHCAGTAGPPLPLTRQMLTRIEAFVHEHIAETILVEQLAMLVHMSASNFARVFKMATGTPPHLYVTLERVKFARTMLCEESIPLVDVGARAGFQTQQHFTEVFHRYDGMTPRAFRLAHRGAGR